MASTDGWDAAGLGVVGVQRHARTVRYLSGLMSGGFRKAASGMIGSFSLVGLSNFQDQIRVPLGNFDQTRQLNYSLCNLFSQHHTIRFYKSTI